MKDSANTFENGSKYKFSQQSPRNALVSMIVHHEYHLTMADHIGFRRTLKVWILILKWSQETQ